MGMNFPDLPTNGQVFGLYTYDGEKWVFTSGPGGITQADADVRYVNVTGDTMTGNLSLNKAGPTITLESTDTNGPGIIGKKDGVPRWLTQMGVLGTSDYYLTYYNDAGAAVGHAYRANRVDGSVNFLSPTASTSPTTGALTVAGGVGIGQSISAGVNIYANNEIVAGVGAPNTGLIRFGAAGTSYLFNNAGKFTLGGGPLAIPDTTASSSPTTGALTVAGGVGITGSANVFGTLSFNGSGTIGFGGVGAGFWYGTASTPNRFFVGTDNAADTWRVYAGGFANNGISIYGATGNVVLPSTTPSTAPTTGALTVAGGVGVGGDIQTSGSIRNTGNIGANGIITTGNTSASGYYYFGNSGTKHLNYDGTNFNLTGGPFIVNSYINSVFSATSGSVYFGNTSNGKYLNYDGVNFNVVGGPLIVPAAVYAQGGLDVTGGIVFKTNASYTPVAGFGIQFAYAGASGWGISFKPANDANHNAMSFYNTANGVVGGIGCTSTATTFNTSSSAELKEDLKTFDAGNIVDNTNVYDFKWRSTGERAYGVIAQQAETVYPTAVTHITNPETKDEFWGVDYSKYVPVLLQELKALRARVAQLEGKTEIGVKPP